MINFRYCLRCSRAVRRRRWIANAVIVSGFAIVLFIPASIVLAVYSNTFHRMINSGPADWWLWSMICALLGGPILSLIGITLWSYGPPVSVIDAGGRTIFFFFRNQHARDLIAAEMGV